MKKQLVTIAFFLGCLLVAGATRAQAQIIYPIKANIPFNFYVGEKLLPAGEYTVREKTPGVMEIQREDGRAAALFLVNDNQERRIPTTSELVFNQYGHQMFLSRIEEQGNQEDVVLMETKLEKRAQLNDVEEGHLSVQIHR